MSVSQRSPLSTTSQRSPLSTTQWRLLLGLAVGVAVGGVAVFVLTVLRPGNAPPRLTSNLFRAATVEWEREQPRNYDIEIQVRGNQPATYFVEVRDGEATLALRNGKPLNQRRTFSTWSVPGMFATMSRDVEVLERRAAGKADKTTPDLHLRATFDPRYGYPARYHRLQYQSSVEVEWEVTRFEVKNGKN